MTATYDSIVEGAIMGEGWKTEYCYALEKLDHTYGTAALI